MDHLRSAGARCWPDAPPRAPRCRWMKTTRVYDGETAEIVAEIKELIATRVRPAVATDGGDIVFRPLRCRHADRAVFDARGACSGLSVVAR